jgi:hypothetical protein
VIGVAGQRDGNCLEKTRDADINQTGSKKEPDRVGLSFPGLSR